MLNDKITVVFRKLNEKEIVLDLTREEYAKRDKKAYSKGWLSTVYSLGTYQNNLNKET